MNRRITFLIVAGVLGVALSVYAYRRLMCETDEERLAKQRLVWRQEKEAEMRRLFDEAIAHASSEREKRLVTLEYEIFRHAAGGSSASSLLNRLDGISEFEALLLAKAYFMREFGACGFVDLPEKRGEEWIVEISSGREARREPTIRIDAQTGTIRCEGHPPIADVEQLLRDPETPNQALQTTPVTHSEIREDH